jgi:uncharacterized protein (DUF1810 family)
MTMPDHQTDEPNDLGRFVVAQKLIYDQALAEVRAGRKRSHWMWFVFPQIAGLGSSQMARFYAIRNREEAAAYTNHPILGPRLRECAEASMSVQGRTAFEIFGSPDDLKLRSCMTLFAAVAEPDSVFGSVLETLFEGARCERTLEILARD